MSAEFKKVELTAIAKKLAYAHHQYLNTMCIAEEITKSDIGRTLNNRMDENLLVEIAKRFAKYVKAECEIDVENGDVQGCQNIINKILYCCIEHDWFKE